MSIPIRVISLERTSERRARFIAAHERLEFEIFPAIDGATLPPAVLQDQDLFVQPLPAMSSGAYGCALSHLRLWERVIEADAPMTIAEDDALFRRDFAVASEGLIALLPANWDLVLWGWNFDSVLSLLGLPDVAPSVMVFNQDALRENVDRYRHQTHRPFPLRLDKCFGLVAYTISPAGARKFKERCFPMQHFTLEFPLLQHLMPNSGVDIPMNRIYASTYSFVSFPPLVVTENRHETSTVQI